MNHDRVISVAADYADALLVARRVKRTLLLILAMILVVQIVIFSVAQWSDLLTRPETTTSPSSANWYDLLHWLSAASLYGSIIFGLVLLATLAITVHIMLVGRLIGVALVLRAFVLAVLLFLLMFPWQTILVTSSLSHGDFALPGVLYTWSEIQDRVLPHTAMDTKSSILYWARFLGMPIVAIIILLLVQKRSGRGLKMALGEEEILPPSE